MKKIVSNVLVVGIQLVIGGLFLFMLFADNNGDNEVVAVNNNNLNKMADAVALLFGSEETKKLDLLEADKKREEELKTAEQRKAEEEAARKKEEEEAKEKARKEAEEAARKKAEEEEARKKEQESQNSTGYNSSTGHTTYTLSDADFGVVAGVIACEATGYDDALGVASVILNRADSGSYPSTPLGVVSAPYQFSCYGYYLNNPGRFAGSRSSYADAALKTALAGTRNNSFYSFNYVCSNPNGGCTQIGGSNGNWYY